MSEPVRGLLSQIRQLTAELELISHAPTVNLHPEAGKNAKEHPGGKKPQGTDREHPDGTAELLDAKEAYQAKTVFRYRRWLSSILDRAGQHDQVWMVGKLTDLRDDLQATLGAWRKPPVRKDQPPTMADPGWKRFVVTGGWDLDRLVSYYGCSRQYLKRVLASDWSVRNESREDRLRRERAEWERRRAA